MYSPLTTLFLLYKMQISQLVLKFENVSKALTSEVKHVVNGPRKKTEEKKVATIEIGTRYIKLNAAYNHQLALKTNKHFEEASGLKVCVASKKYTIYVFL